MQDYLRPNFQRLRSEPEDVMKTAFEQAHNAIYEAIKRQPDTFEQDMDTVPSAKGMGKMLVMEVDEDEWELGYDAVDANPNPTPTPNPNPSLTPNPNRNPNQVRRRGRRLDGLGRRDHRWQDAGLRCGGRLVLTLRGARADARRHADNHRADPRAFAHQREGVGGPAA